MNPDLILKTVQDISREIVAPMAHQTDQEARWPAEGLSALQAEGLGGLVVPVEQGGLGQGLLTLVKVGELLGKACGSTALCYGMHCVGVAIIAAKSTPDQKERYLLPINQGKHLTTLALSESGSGSHFYYPQTQLIKTSNDVYTISGNKSFVTNGGYADSYVISTMATEKEVPLGQFSCLMVDKETEGLVWGEAWDGSGMRGNSSRSVAFEQLQIPRKNLLGEEGDQIWYIFNIVAPYFLVAMAGTYLGIATAALEQAIKHLKKRTFSHRGSGLKQVTLLQHRLGSLWSQVERTRRLIYFAAEEADHGGADALVALCTSKAEVANCAVNVVNEAMTLMGGIAYRKNDHLERLMREARAAHIMAPTTDILLTWAGRALLELPLLSDM